jgi:hypothetical protein
MAVSLRAELRSLPENYMVLLILNVKQYFEGVIEVLRMLCNEENLPGIYITVNKPYGTMKELLRDRGVNTSRIFFIDAISQTVTQPKLTNHQVIYLPNPQSLTDLSLALNAAATALEGSKKFLFMDSLSTLLIYNETESVAKFAHFLTIKMRSLNIKGVLIALRQMLDEELIFEVAQYCDRVIDLSSEVIELDR